jgi:hypothetical protein
MIYKGYTIITTASDKGETVYAVMFHDCSFSPDFERIGSAKALIDDLTEELNYFDADLTEMIQTQAVSDYLDGASDRPLSWIELTA